MVIRITFYLRIDFSMGITSERNSLFYVWIGEVSSHLKVLNFLDELDILLGQTLLVGGDVHDSAVQLLDLDVQLADVDLEPLTCLGDGNLLLGHVLHLGQQLVNFSLEFRLLLLRPGDKEMYVAITGNDIFF